MKPRFPLPPAPATVLSRVFQSNITRNTTQSMLKHIPNLVKRLPAPPFFIQKKIGEQVLQKLLAEQIEMQEFDFLQGHFLQLCIDDMGLSFFLTFNNKRLILADSAIQADVIFRGNSREFLLLASRLEDPDTLFFQRRLIIEGDTELGLYIKNSIDGIDFDNWPKWLNQLIQKVARLVNTAEETELNYPPQGLPSR